MNRQLKFTSILTIGMMTHSCKDKVCIQNGVDEVSILVVNQSGQDITSISLQHEKGSINNGKLGINSQTCLTYKSPGENSYVLTAILERGDTLTTSEYTEGGYSLTQIITADSITRQYQKSY